MLLYSLFQFYSIPQDDTLTLALDLPLSCSVNVLNNLLCNDSILHLYSRTKIKIVTGVNLLLSH
jgi:hypothetical protein